MFYNVKHWVAGSGWTTTVVQLNEPPSDKTYGVAGSKKRAVLTDQIAAAGLIVDGSYIVEKTM